MCATGCLNQTTQCELMAWKHWEICARIDPYIETDPEEEYKEGSRRQWDTSMLNGCRDLRSPQPWKWLSNEKYSAFINLEEIWNNMELRWRKERIEPKCWGELDAIAYTHHCPTLLFSPATSFPPALSPPPLPSSPLLKPNTALFPPGLWCELGDGHA